MRQIIYQYRLAPSLQETSMQERSMADS